MGICKKCKKKTDLYCFKHKHYICVNCLASADNEHASCYVGSYSDFLHLSAEEVDALVQSTCPTCSEAFDESKQFFRLPCLHLIHQECLEKIVSGLPADTARGGFTCPKCNKPVFSSGDVSDDVLASALVTRLHDLPWAAPLLATASGAQPAETASPEQPSTSTEKTEPEAETQVEKTQAPDDSKQSASSLFIKQSQNVSAHPPAQQQQQQHHKPQPRNTVATGVPGVGLFMPPPPPKPQSVESLPIAGSAFSNLPLSDRVDGEEVAGEEFLNIQIPPLGSRLAARKALPLGGDYGSGSYYNNDDDDNKIHHSAIAQVVNYFGLAKRENGKMVIDKTKLVTCLAVLLFIVFIFTRVFASGGEQPTVEAKRE